MYSPSRGLALHSWYTYTSLVVIVSMLAWATGLPGFLMYAHAAQLSNVSDTLSTSEPGADANHSISFNLATAVYDDGSTIAITIPTGFDMSYIDEDDIDIADDGVDLTTANACGAVEAGVSTSTGLITIEICNSGGATLATSSTITIEVGTNATASGSGSEQITNHANAGDYELSIGGTMADNGATRLIIIDSVIVTGAVDTYLLFEIDGVDAGETVNADATTLTGTSTATSVPFGTVAPSTEYIVAQDLAVTTNAADGFTVTVEAGGDLQSTTGAIIDSFVDGDATSTPIAWQAPAGTVGDDTTFGHWGLTTEDITLTDDDSFGNALYAGNFIDTPREVMYATTSADGTAAHIGATRVGYKLEINTMQEAATDYTTTLTYVVTPVF